METISNKVKFNSLVQELVITCNNINNEHIKDIYTQAPIIIYQRFCNELVEVMKVNPNKAAKDVPKALDILTSINILQELYPELKKHE